MFRSVFLVLLVFCAGGCCAGLPQAAAQTAAAPSAPSAEAAAAKQIFLQCQQQLEALYVQLGNRTQALGSGSQANPPLQQEIQNLTAQTHAMLDQVASAGADVLRAGLTTDPTVNQTLQAIALFYVSGDQAGDGGDQYEKALPLISALLNAGLGSTAPELWLAGGVCAVNVNDFPLAQQYFSQAQGLRSQTPPQQGRNPLLNRIWKQAQTQHASLAATRQAWQKEQALRARDAAADDLPRVKLQTSQGDIVIELFENEAPQAVANFLSLVKSGYYQGVVFHRVLPGFMAQGGDPTGTGSGGPGYQIRCECEGPNIRQHFRGSLSMAHAGKNTGGSQFFLTFVPTSYLDGRHTVFGRVIEGIEAASALRRRDPSGPGPHPEPDKILQAQVLRDRGHAYTFEKLPAR
jgi:cyclophilin family peptidyl-prolyl cis-trans isomerase